MKETAHIHQMNNFGTMFASPIVSNQLNTYNMKRVHNTILSALIITSGVSIIGITQSHTWEQLSMFTFGAGISLFMIGLIATEK